MHSQLIVFVTEKEYMRFECKCSGFVKLKHAVQTPYEETLKRAGILKIIEYHLCH